MAIECVEHSKTLDCHEASASRNAKSQIVANACRTNDFASQIEQSNAYRYSDSSLALVFETIADIVISERFMGLGSLLGMDSTIFKHKIARILLVA